MLILFYFSARHARLKFSNRDAMKKWGNSA